MTNNIFNSYAIYLGNKPIAIISGTEAAYEAYRAAVVIAELTGETACLVWNGNGEIIASSDEEEGD